MINFLFNPKTPILVTVLALLAAIIAVWFAPSEFPIHFTNGQADRFVSRWVGLFALPVLMIVLLYRRWREGAGWLIYVLALLQICMLWLALI